MGDARSAGLLGPAEYGGGAPMVWGGLGLRVGCVVTNGFAVLSAFRALAIGPWNVEGDC